MLSDILDGYYPYDLKMRYPEGAPLHVIDHTEEKYVPAPTEDSKAKDSYRSPTRPLYRDKSAPKAAAAVSAPKITSTNTAVDVETHVTRAEKEGKTFPAEQIVTLRVRTENAKHYLMLRLLAADLMAAVYECARPYRYITTRKRDSEKEGKFTVRSTFPRQEYPENERRSLKELGLAPTAALVMQ